MRVLALDTTARAGSVALVEDDCIVALQRGDPSRTHAERLPRDILSLLGDRGLGPSDVDLFAVASGPGSFTGLRVGIATIQGLACVQRRHIAAVPSLEALAQATGGDLSRGAVIGAWMDAQRGDVFTALYRIGSAPPFDRQRLIGLEGAAVGDPARTLIRWAHIVERGPMLIAGDGAVTYGDVIRSGALDVRVVEPLPLAGAIGRMAAALARTGGLIDPVDARPLYVRRPDAEIDREKRAFTTKDTKDTKETIL